MKKILVGIMLLLALLTANDDMWAKRNSAAGAKEMFDYYKTNYKTEVNYETAWKFARASYFYGEYFVTDKNQQKEIFTNGRKAALAAVKEDDSKVEGHYWLGVCTGGWAEANGVMKSLRYADDIADEMTKVIEIEPGFRNGSAYMVRAKVYYKAPGFPLSVGSEKKAKKDFAKAWEYGKENRKLHRFYATYLLSKDKKEKALEIIKKGLALPLDEKSSVQENEEIKLLKELKTEAS